MAWRASAGREPTSAQTYSRGQNASPAFEGWETNPDGSFNFLFGYMNRNWEEEIDVPIGPDNNIEPGGPDQGQPTRLLPRRNRFIFRVRVPKDWGQKELVWTLTTKGKTEKAYATLRPGLLHRRRGHRVGDRRTGRRHEQPGDPREQTADREARRRKIAVDQSRSEPLTLVAWVTDDGVPKAAHGSLGRRRAAARRGRPTRRHAAPRNPLLIPPSRVTVGKRVGLHLSWFVYRAPA